MSAALAPIAQALFESLHPLALAAENKDYREHLLRQLGWDEDAAAELFVLGPQFVDWWKRGLEHQAELAKAVAAKDGESQFLHAMLLLEIAFELSDAIAARKGKPSDGPLKPDVREALWNDLALALPEYLLLRWLRLYKPLLYWVLRITDVVEIESVDGNKPARIAADVSRLRIERIGPLLAEPEAYLKGRYDWGFDAASLSYAFRHNPSKDAPLRHGRLMQVLHRLFTELGLRPRLSAVHQRYVGDGGKNLDGSARLFEAGSKALSGARQLTVPLVQGRAGNGPWTELGLELIPLAGTRGPDTIDGLYLTNLSRGAKAGSLPLGEGWTLAADGAVEASGAVGVRMLPGQVKLESTLPSSKFELRCIGQPPTPWVLMGSNTGTRLELRGAEAGLSVEQLGSQAELRVFYEPKAKDGGPGMVLLLAPGEGDGFVQELLGDKEMQVAFDLGFDWSSLSGLQITGEGGLCVTLPLNLTLGPATLNEVHLCLSAGTEGLTLLGAVTAEARLGPVVCSVKDIGIEFRLGFGAGARKGESFGAVSLDAAFKPPSGVGLGIDSPAVSAGGYLEFDRERGEYGGTATVGIGPLALTAVGLLDVKLPEPPGWSLLLSICADFTPVPLGFGFTLNGVGGLIGIGRTLDVKALQRQLAAGALDAVMFPEDPVGNGPAIIDTLRSLFPVAQGQTVVGPMMKIGWGAPTLIDADLGVLIELPEPIRITLLGQIASELPTKQLGLVKLHLDSLGSFNLSELSLAIDAALYDSWMVGYTLSGSLAIRARFGADPSFLFSLGGFHPEFTAPKGFPKMKPMAIGLSFDEDLKIEAQSYLALTSNTIQFGAHIVVVAKLRILTLEGGAGFDVLVNFSPFSFVADFDAFVDIRVGSKELLGVSVAATLSGPEPWFFNGTATFRVLYKDWNFDVQFKLAGKKTPVKLDKVDAGALVRAALCEPNAWSQVGAQAAGVQLAQAQPVAAAATAPDTLPTLMLRPDMALEVRQRVAPLGVELEKFGNHEIAGAATVGIERAVFGTASPQQMADIEDWFAPAEYFVLSKDERIDAPSFEKLPAGKQLAVGGFAAGSAAERSLAHEYSVIDRDLDEKLARPSSPRKGNGRLAAQAKATRAAVDKASGRGRQRFKAQAAAPRFKPPAWRVIDVSSTWCSADATTFAAARRVLLQRLSEKPQLKGRLRVVPVTATATAGPAPVPPPAPAPTKGETRKRTARKTTAHQTTAHETTVHQTTAPKTRAPRRQPT
jgi:hypothetical protein